LAASAILRRRLTVVCSCWSQAHGDRREQAENVHALRVSTRRAVAALDAFRSLLPKKRRRKLKSELRKVRKSVDQLRNLDVLAELLVSSPRRPGRRRQALVDRLREERCCVLEALNMQRQCTPPLRRQAQKTLARVTWRKALGRKEPSLGDFARRSVRQSADRFLHAALSAQLDSMDGMHRLRIQAKKLRYTLELFGDALPAERCKEVRRELRKLQQELGTIRDHAMAADWIARVAQDAPAVGAAARQKPLAAGKPALDASSARALIEYHQQIAADQAQDFCRRWTVEHIGGLRSLLHGLATDG
jgi:CHAD domain-containing protein